MAKELAVILNDGSIESAVTTALAAQRHRLALVHISTHEPGAPRRRAAFDAQSTHFAAQKSWALPLPPVEGPPQNPLTSAIAPIALTLHAATRWKAAAVHLPLRTGPAPDDLARGTEYLQIWNELLQLPCTHENLQVLAPILELDPWQVIDLAFQIDAPLELTWSCQTSNPAPCTLCDPCKARASAFLRAVKPDPLLLDRRVPPRSPSMDFPPK